MANTHRRIETLTMDVGAPIERGFRAPFNGKVVSVGLSVNVVTDATNAVTTEIDNTAITGGAFSVTTARAVGYTEKKIPTAALSFREGQYVSAVSDGAGTAGNCSITFELQED